MRIQRQFHSNTDSTVQPTNRIQGEFHSKTSRFNNLTHNRIQRKFNVYSIQRQIQPLNPEIGLNVNYIQSQIQPLNTQIGFNVNSIQRQIQPLTYK